MASAMETGQMMSDDHSVPGGARRSKAAGAFRTISEVADDLDVAQHVLRFWESKFPQVRPLKRGGGRRYYRPEDVDLLRRIRSLLYEEGYTIKGAQKLLRGQRRSPANPPTARENGSSRAARQEQPPAPPAAPPLEPLDPRQKEALAAIRTDLALLRDRLRKFLP
jgi:DNA-binding transcriptional MerR regulator